MTNLHLFLATDPVSLSPNWIPLSILIAAVVLWLAWFSNWLKEYIPDLQSPSAIVIDHATGKVLGSKDPDTRRAMASVTKIMTAILAVEYVKEDDILNELVTIEKSDKDKDGEGGKGTQLALEVNTKDDPNSPIKLTLEVGDKISFGDLLYGMIRLSANDAAVAIARHVAGSREAFVKRMNERASELGLQNTSFVGASGVDPEDYVTGCKGDDFDNPLCAHYSTARDLANLTRHALSEPLLADILAVKSAAHHRSRPLDGIERNARLFRVEEAVELRPAGLHPRRHLRFRQREPFHLLSQLPRQHPFERRRATVLIKTFFFEKIIEIRASMGVSGHIFRVPSCA
jgi:D-alanyl-D-alanine carboxypeptidase